MIIGRSIPGRPRLRWGGVVRVAGLAAALLAPHAPARAAAEPDRVTVQLKWHHQTQFAGVYVADAKGFYRAERLAVEYRPWRVGDPSPVAQVLSGRAAFGITSHTEFLVALEKGAPVVAIAAIYQKSPVGFFVLKGSGIKHPRDFAGKTIAFAPTHEIHLKAVLKRVGLDLRSLRPVPYRFDLTPFYKGEVAIWAGYVMNQPVDARLAGYETTVIFPDDYGVHTYDDIVFTSRELLAGSPALAERWLRATLRGWRYAVEHPEEATEIALRVDPQLKREKQLAMLLASIPLIHTGDHPIGWMTREVWAEAAEILLDQGLLAQRPDLARAYTTALLERIHGGGHAAGPAR
ncbi:MAG TPA: ABC transporter substrate-binding protein [Thermodesulfobacteriota bacterium]|nr:ABC transporter substrate-binding protein [Thermodesulfobacteriota bacterium]